MANPGHRCRQMPTPGRAGSRMCMGGAVLGTGEVGVSLGGAVPLARLPCTAPNPEPQVLCSAWRVMPAPGPRPGSLQGCDLRAGAGMQDTWSPWAQMGTGAPSQGPSTPSAMLSRAQVGPGPAPGCGPTEASWAPHRLTKSRAHGGASLGPPPTRLRTLRGGVGLGPRC